MIRDILTLRARLRVASVSLLTAAGCASPGTSEVVPTPKAVEPVAVDKPTTSPQPPSDPPDPPSPPIAEPPISQYPRPTCPSGTWSGTLEEAQKRTADLTKSLDCPAAIHGIVDPERKSAEAPPGARAHLDEAATKALGAGHCSYTAELVRLACDTFVEGCVGETIAALVATRAARRCTDPSVTAGLARIADDEAEHAALAWATVAWAVTQGGETVRSAVRALARDMHAAAMRAEPPAPAPSTALLAHHGRLDAAAHHACLVDAWQHLIADAVAELCGDSHPASDRAQA
ncbi:hypothetical protein OV090_44715 [Nannocystis sp. RBIL2]|uniref:hypothetical protein n=1 Tax=Nannocystis sp. RBIL2 TaxID=2996788 RepID=UPI00226EFB1C|nr:hypothetical protein [Nannocystis sp. RBIL2]MCY1071931.1 hypothetical protein [Nannocystis sp. RBIL2]